MIQDQGDIKSQLTLKITYSYAFILSQLSLGFTAIKSILLNRYSYYCIYTTKNFWMYSYQWNKKQMLIIKAESKFYDCSFYLIMNINVISTQNNWEGYE